MTYTTNKIFLIGGRATGKTTVGVLLAERLGLSFLDMDKVIESRQGRTIQEIVEAEGWPFFRGLERDLLVELSSKSDLVIATGGGAVLHQEVWPKVMESGLVVWLDASLEVIRDRLLGDEKTDSQRPSLTGDEVVAEIAKILAERQPLYQEGAHLRVEADQQVEVIVGMILEEIKK